MESSRYYSLSELNIIKDALSNFIQGLVPKLFSTVEYRFKRECTLFIIHVPRRYVPKVKKKVSNWYILRSVCYKNLKFEVRATPGIE